MSFTLNLLFECAATEKDSESIRSDALSIFFRFIPDYFLRNTNIRKREQRLTKGRADDCAKKNIIKRIEPNNGGLWDIII
jgi:hypothetical protein